MKNKLLKTLTCFAGISAIWSTVAIASTSCGCSNSKSNILPKNVYDIQDNVLLGFKDDFLNNPDSEIYQDNFKDYDTMQIPANVTSVNGWAFFDFQKGSTIPHFITKLTFAENSNFSSIGEGAFYAFQLLTSIVFPNSLINLEQGAFYKCTSLTSIDLSKTNVSIIGDSAFYNCKSLTSVMFASSLTTIGEQAFQYFSLTSLNLQNCLNLKTIKKMLFIFVHH